MRIIQQAVLVLQERLVQEAKLRSSRTFEEWSRAEINAVWFAARDFAQQHGLRVPLLAEVEAAEVVACGHSDYGHKWALLVAEKMNPVL